MNQRGGIGVDGRHGKGRLHGVAASALALVATSLVLAPQAQAQARARPAAPSPPRATTGVVAPRPAAPAGHEPRVRPGRSQTAGRTGFPVAGAPPNVARPPNVGRIPGFLPHLPGPFTRLRVGGRIYYYCLGGFYVRQPGGYELSEAPAGAVVRSLPRGHEEIELGGRTLFYHAGVFYEPGRRPGEYVVVRAPLGAVVGHLPADAVETVIGGVTYHLARGVYYLAVRRDGALVYVVTDPHRA